VRLFRGLFDDLGPGASGRLTGDGQTGAVALGFSLKIELVLNAPVWERRG
jgi:hypothetical protein